MTRNCRFLAGIAPIDNFSGYLQGSEDPFMIQLKYHCLIWSFTAATTFNYFKSIVSCE